MKKAFLFSVVCGAGTFYAVNSHAQANRALSNLTAPTSVNQSLLPQSDNSKNLGSATKSWKNLYLDSSVYLGGARFLAGTGIANTAVGLLALNANTTGYYNTANGWNALFSNTIGYYNTANGFSTLYFNTSGAYNTANGSRALFYNTTGHNNTANGYRALFNNTTGGSNTVNGALALFNNTTGYDNTANGLLALYKNTTGGYNTALGYNAGSGFKNGYNNVFVGANTDVNSADYYNDIAIGQGTICTGVSQARFGNSTTVSIGGYANWTNISDGRVKKNIKSNVPGLAFINKLKPITYNLDLEAADKIIQPPARKDKDAPLNEEVGQGKIAAPSQFDITARNAKQQIIYTGFVAQDVEKAAKELNYDFSGVDAAKNNKDLYGLRYAEFVVPLVKAVQELSKANDAKDEKINNLQQQIDELKRMMLT